MLIDAHPHLIADNFMLSSNVIKQALKEETEPQIYSRGLDYFRRGLVRKLSAKDSDGILIIKGTVEGGENYHVKLEFNLDGERFVELECDCPYWDVCKHAVALGLAFADSLGRGDGNFKAPMAADVRSQGIEKKINSRIDETGVRQAPQDLGLAAEDMPADLIRRLLNYHEAPVKPTPIFSDRRQKLARLDKPKPFNPRDYYIAVDAYSGYIPTFYEKDSPDQQPGITKILERDDLSASQRELLTYIKDSKLGYFQSPRPDPAKLFPLIVASGIPVYNSRYLWSNARRLVIDLYPQPLKAEIVYEPAPLYGDESKVCHDFFLRMPAEYWKGRNYWDDKPWYICGSSVVRDIDRTVELHQLTPLIAGILSRLQPRFDYNSHKLKNYEAILTGEELTQFDQLVSDASRMFNLTSAPPQLKPQAVASESQAALLVDFDHSAQTLRVMPAVDYEIFKQDVSESVYISRRDSGDILCRRPPYEHPGTHIIIVAGNVIHHAKVDEKKEIEIHRTLAERAQNLGFTKTLKCQKRGARQITEYLRTVWPALSAYAKDNGYPIIFAKDKLSPEQVTFRADFTTDINTDNDWLYFDAACYCGDEKVTLEKLLAYLDSGQSFWRKDDGTLVEIANREELERLARLIESFHARENGGFEGRLCHAPELEYVITSSEHYNAARAKSFQQFLSRMQKGKPIVKVRLPPKLARVLRPYQRAGIEWLYFLRSYRFAGILADDMGLGKTLETLAVLSLEKVSRKPSVVVCPKTLLYNWQLEAKKFFPKLRVLVYEGMPWERLAMLQKFKQYDLVITGYGSLKQDEDEWAKSGIRFNYAVLDEAQFIKNHATKNAQAVKKLNADYRLALTGTPLENSVSELWSIYDFLMPGFLGNYGRFTERFHKPIMDEGSRQALEHLRHKVENFMLRRTKAEVLKDLPPKIEQTSQCHLSEAQNILYQQILANVRGEVFDAVNRRGFKSAQIHILAGLTKLRQVCNHPALLVKEKNWRQYESAKLEMCLELVEEVAKGRRKVLVFSQFTQMLDIVSAALRDRGITHSYLSGKTRDRQNVVAAFNADPAITAFLISMKAGGTGLNLTAADTVIIFDPWWNPSVENQAADRVHRIGQTKTVNVYRLVTLGTIEEKIQALKQKKQRLFDALIGESGDLFKKLTWDDVRGLFAD